MPYHMKKQSSILRLVAQGESQTLELKQSFGREAIETISAFANTEGGAMLIGVHDKGVVIGVSSPKSALRNWANQISQATGGLHPSIEAVAVKGKTVV